MLVPLGGEYLFDSLEFAGRHGDAGARGGDAQAGQHAGALFVLARLSGISVSIAGRHRQPAGAAADAPGV